MSDSGFSGNIGGLRGAVQNNGGRNGQAVRLISAPADLASENQTQRVAGVIGNISAQDRQGRVQIQTDQGDIIVQVRDGLARQLQAGQNVVVEIPAENYDRQARLYLTDNARQVPSDVQRPDVPVDALPAEALPAEDAAAQNAPFEDASYRPDGQYSDARNIRDVLRSEQNRLPQAQDVVDQGRSIQLSALSEDVARSVIVPPRDISQQVSNVTSSLTAPSINSISLDNISSAISAIPALNIGDPAPVLLASSLLVSSPSAVIENSANLLQVEGGDVTLSRLGLVGDNLSLTTIAPQGITGSQGIAQLSASSDSASSFSVNQGQYIGSITFTEIGNATSGFAQFSGLFSVTENGQNQSGLLLTNRLMNGFYQGLSNTPSGAFSQIGQIIGQVVAVTHDQRPVLQLSSSAQSIIQSLGQLSQNAVSSTQYAVQHQAHQGGTANNAPGGLFTAPVSFTNTTPNGGGYIPALGGVFSAHISINAASSLAQTTLSPLPKGAIISSGLLGQVAGQVSVSLFGGPNAAGFGFAPISSEFFALLQNGQSPSFPGQIIPGDLAPGSWQSLNDIQTALSSASLSAGASSVSAAIAGHQSLQNASTGSDLQAGSQISQNNADIIAQSTQSTTAISMSSMGNILPSPLNPALLGAGLMFFMSALRGGDAAQWLGSKNQDQLKRMGKGDLIDDFRREGAAINGLGQSRGASGGDDNELAATAFHALINEGSAPPSKSDVTDLDGWDVIIVPIEYQGQIDRVTIWSRQEEIAPDIKTKGQRFVFDMYLQKMGALQIDGLSYGKNLDMVLRTQRPISTSMQQIMQSSYHDVLTASGQAGRIYFHVFKDCAE